MVKNDLCVFRSWLMGPPRLNALNSETSGQCTGSRRHRKQTAPEADCTGSRRHPSSTAWLKGIAIWLTNHRWLVAVHKASKRVSPESRQALVLISASAFHFRSRHRPAFSDVFHLRKITNVISGGRGRPRSLSTNNRNSGTGSSVACRSRMGFQWPSDELNALCLSDYWIARRDRGLWRKGERTCSWGGVRGKAGENDDNSMANMEGILKTIKDSRKEI